MTDKKDIDQVLAAFLSGTASDYDIKLLKEWQAENKLNAYQFDQLQKVWKERLPDPKLIDSHDVRNRIWNAVNAHSSSKEETRRRTLSKTLLWRAAAVFLLLIIPIYLTIRYSSKSEQEKELRSEVIEKTNPIGQKSKIQLPDGSIVWLNADSHLAYTEDLIDSVRWVKLKGEAFFSVMKDSLFPFIVHTENMKIQVLGTQFNVSAFSDFSKEKVALLEGKVEISFLRNDRLSQKIFLIPGEGISYDKSEDVIENFAVGSLDPDKNRYAAWKEGMLVFDGEDFDEFLQVLRRWYGVRIIVKGSPPENWHIRASFKDEYLSNIMEAISFNKEFTYDIDRKDLTIMFK